MAQTAIPADGAAVEALMGRLFEEATAAGSAVLGYLGVELGLWAALAGAGPLTAAEVAERTGCHERWVREWLLAEAAGGFVSVDAGPERFTLSPEAALVLADERGPAFMGGVYSLAIAGARDADRLASAFRSGTGLAAFDRDPLHLRGLESIARPTFEQSLAGSWIPALDGVLAKLTDGASVADVGCGAGVSTIILGREFPNSRYWGFDYDDAAIARARASAAKAGVAGRVQFAVADAAGYPGRDYDLVCMFDAFHDLGDPVGAAAHVHKTLKPDGTLMLVEPYALAGAGENVGSPVGRFYYIGSTLYCIPTALAQGGEMALGAQAGEARTRELLEAAGFSRFRRCAETAFQVVYEVRP